jgi:hypothetical protein
MAAYGYTITKQLLWLKAKSFQPQNTNSTVVAQTHKTCAPKKILSPRHYPAADYPPTPSLTPAKTPSIPKSFPTLYRA